MENEDYNHKPGVEILLNDTIGFIRDLPPELIAAFRSTLEDSIESDILLHVIDASDPWMAEKIRIVDETLDHIGATQPRIRVYNKVDMLSPQEQAEKFQSGEILVSAHKGRGIEELRELIYQHLDSFLL